MTVVTTGQTDHILTALSLLLWLTSGLHMQSCHVTATRWRFHVSRRGLIYGVRGMLDFLLLPKKWGFELLRDGKAMQEHADRFV